jgi:hypothetical protein
VICHLQYLAQDAYARAGSALGQVLSGLIAAAFPNFQIFALGDSLGAADLPAAEKVLWVVAYALGYVVVAAGLAVFSFRRREI